jgi:hypothetical protein
MKKKITTVFARINLIGTNETIWLVGPGRQAILAYLLSKYRKGAYYDLRFISAKMAAQETGSAAQVERFANTQRPERGFQWHLRWPNDSNLVAQSP